jgi:hypothetical protein
LTGRRGRKRRKLLDELKERRGYSHLKEEALDRSEERRVGKECVACKICRATDLLSILDASGSRSETHGKF